MPIMQIAECTGKDPVPRNGSVRDRWTETDYHGEELRPYTANVKSTRWLYLVGLQSGGIRTTLEAI